MRYKEGDKMTYNKVKELRQQNGIKQKEVAEYLNLKISTYSSKESGARKFTIYEGMKLADFFNCDVKDIFLNE